MTELEESRKVLEAKCDEFEEMKQTLHNDLNKAADKMKKLETDKQELQTKYNDKEKEKKNGETALQKTIDQVCTI
ncbi:hypothetical protein DPMN_094141 [Dreissena polymorpha]|uniref:Uncharacterized protein n=1 Tax=Dreissena polymorpha TaxID=45954 RepID=A0A9D4L5J9_DREPO|nr:hypothetical protein DPMN_094141 [Dreissena polymorpha]